MAKCFGNLPEVMVIEILVRVPVKSLVQCKSVCKPWLSMISNSSFIKSQLHHAIRNNPTLLKIINEFKLSSIDSEHQMEPSLAEFNQQQRQRCQLINQALLDTKRQDLSTTGIHFDRVVMPRLFEFTQSFSCCNGIICLGDIPNDVVYLWNPSIRQFKKLPDPPNASLTSSPIMIGFGYDSISDDYKVVRFVYGKGSGCNPIVQLYSTNADSYRVFEAPLLKNWLLYWLMYFGTIMNPYYTIVVSGVLYFDGGDVLVSFDFHTEVLRLVPFPDLVQIKWSNDLAKKRKKKKWSNVLDFEGSVAMVFQTGSEVDLWTLDYVSGEFSWKKNISIEYGSEVDLRTLDYVSGESSSKKNISLDLWLSCYVGERQFYGSKLLNPHNRFVYEVLYDYEKKEIKYYALGEEYVNIYAIPEDSESLMKYVHATLKYTETLVSLDGFKQLE